MEMQSFLDALRDRLYACEVEEAEIERYIKQFERYFNTMSEEEVLSRIGSFDSVDGIAQNIVNLIARKKDREEEPFPDESLAERTVSFEPVDENDPMPTTQEYDSVGETAVNEALLAELQSTDEFDGFESDFLAVPGEEAEKESEPETAPAEEPRHKEAEKTASDEPTLPENTADLSITLEDIEMGSTADMEPVKEKGDAAVSQATRIDMPAAVQTEDEEANGEASAEEFPFDDDLFEEYIPANGMFWGITVASFIIWCPLLILAACLYGAAYAVLGLCVAALIACVVAVIIVGTGLSLIGLIYGITQLGVSRPVALYEIGLGLALAGAALLGGVLLYNGAVRFMPWVIRKMNVFSQFSLRQLRRLVRRFKKACIR